MNPEFSYQLYCGGGKCLVIKKYVDHEWNTSRIFFSVLKSPNFVLIALHQCSSIKAFYTLVNSSHGLWIPPNLNPKTFSFSRCIFGQLWTCCLLNNFSKFCFLRFRHGQAIDIDMSCCLICGAVSGKDLSMMNTIFIQIITKYPEELFELFGYSYFGGPCQNYFRLKRRRL